MSLIAPETITKKIIEQINAVIFSNDYYLPASGFQIRRLESEAAKLIQANPYDGYIAKSLILSLTGQINESLSCLLNAERLSDGLSLGEVDFIRAQIYARLGYFSEGLACFKQSADLKSGHFGSRAEIGLIVGAFSFLLSQFQRAEELGMSVQTNIDIDRLYYINQLMAEHGLTDAKIAAFMDAAGKVARTRGLSLKEQVMDLQESEESCLLRILIEVGCSAKERAAMLFELAERLADLPEMPSGFHVAFKGIDR